MQERRGLRERKRLATIQRIQETALDLFDARGYAGVTIEEVADAADVSPSTVYRYFGSKEQLVLRDEVDLQLLGALERELAIHPPVEAVRRAIAGALPARVSPNEAIERRKTRYWLEEPALRAAAADETNAFVEHVASSLARAAGRQPDDLEVQVVAAALVWSLVAAVRHWHAGGYTAPLEQELARALDVVDRGLRLDAPATNG